MSHANTKNRNRITFDGHPVSKHTGGSRSTHDTKVYMEEKLDRQVTAAEVYIFMHTSKTQKCPIDNNASDIELKFKRALPEIVPYLGQKGVPIPDDMMQKADKTLVETLVEYSGGGKKWSISGLGNLSSHYFKYSSSRAQYLIQDTQVHELTQHVSELTSQNRMLNEKIQVMDAEMVAIRQFKEKFSS